MRRLIGLLILLSLGFWGQAASAQGSKQGRCSQKLEEGSPVVQVSLQQVILKQVILRFSLRLHNVLIPPGAIATSTYAARCL